VEYEGKIYSTSEHLYQSFKFQDPILVERIRECPGPMDAYKESRILESKVRSDWNQVKIKMMDVAIWHKFTQHPDLRAELLATGNAELVEDSDQDSFWGVGGDRRGRNEMGKALERLREKLRLTSRFGLTTTMLLWTRRVTSHWLASTRLGFHRLGRLLS